MRHLDGDVKNVAWSHFLADAALDRLAASLSRSGGARLAYGPAYNQRALAGCDENYVHLRVVYFGFAIALALDHPECMIVPGGELVHTDFVIVHLNRVDGRFEFGAGPHRKTGGIGGNQRQG